MAWQSNDSVLHKPAYHPPSSQHEEQDTLQSDPAHSRGPISTPSGPHLPPISEPLRKHLEQDIISRGVMVPVLITQDGEVIDGRLRQAIALEHGLT